MPRLCHGPESPTSRWVPRASLTASGNFPCAPHGTDMDLGEGGGGCARWKLGEHEGEEGRQAAQGWSPSLRAEIWEVEVFHSSLNSAP